MCRLGEQGEKAAAGRGTSEGEALLTCLIHEFFRFVNNHLQEKQMLSCRFRRGALHLAQG